MPKRGSLYLRFTCMLMIYLLIMPVLHSANVFAEFFGDIHGYDGVPGFRKVSGDVTIINVSASIPGETISPSQVKLISDPTRPFECAPPNASVPALCEMRVPGELPPGPHLYEVQLFGSDGSEVSAKIPLTIYADNLAPDIHHFELERNGSDVVAAYQVSDQACDGCGPEVCAGVDRIVFLLNYVEVGSVFPDTGECLLQPDTTALRIEPTGGSTTTKTICLNAYDRLDQKSSECMDIVMDFSPPQLINASLWLGDFPVRYTKGEPIGNARLQAFISEGSELDVDSVIADFSALTARPEFKEVYRNIDMSEQYQELFSPQCRNVSEGLYECTWDDLLVILPSGIVPEIRISALDSLSNRMNSSYTLPIEFDNTPPQVTAIRTGIADERGRYWVGTGNNTILVDVTDEGSGLSDRKLFLDVGSFGSQEHYDGNTLLMPLNCSLGWTCTYPFVNVVTPRSSGQALPVSLSIGSADDAGNSVEGTTSTGLYFDAEAPQVIGVQNSSICPTAPDSIDITVNVSERYSGGVKAYVDAPELSSNYFPMEFDCEESEIAGVWTCDISIDNLVTYYVDGTINLTLEDRAGNRNTTTLHQEVCEAAPGTPPNVVRTVACEILPSSGIDRQIAEKIPVPIFVRPTLQPATTGAGVQEVRIERCSSEGAEFSDEYILTELEFEKPLIGTKVRLGSEVLGNASDTGEDSIDIDCELHLIVRAGTKVYQEPEIENVRCEGVPVHGTVFGGLNSSLKSTLADIESQISAKEGEIDDYEGWLDVLGTFCTIAELSAMITAALQILREVIWVVSIILYAISFTRSAGESLYFATCKVTEWITGIVMTFIWNIDANPATSWDSTGYYFKILCGIAMCRLSEQNTIVELIGGAAGAEWSPANERSYDKFIDDTSREGAENRFPEGGSAPTDIPDDVYKVIFSAYRSKECAQWSACLPGYVFALKKERQLLCMKRNCYRDYVAAGFSPDICDKLYSGRQCLYIHSAAYKVAGDSVAARILLGVVEYMLVQTLGSLASWGFREGFGSGGQCAYPWGISDLNEIRQGVRDECGTSSTDSPLPSESLGSHICGLGIALMIYQDVGDWLDGGDFTWNAYEQKLGDPDYCSM